MSAPFDVALLGVRPSCSAVVAPDQVARLAAVLDVPAPGAGAALPLLWWWAFFTPTAPTSALGPDGHAALPPDGPTAGLPRRMWAGGRVRASGSLVVGEPAVRESRVVSATRKQGRSGALLVVTVVHRYLRDGAEVAVEEQDLVYRAAGAAVPEPVGAVVAEAPAGGWAELVTVDEVRLFRFSAVTFNAHRIHYDASYARDVEGYPGLVVHGPLTALLLAQSACVRTGTPLRAFSFRASAPLFAGLPFTVVGRAAQDSVELSAVRNDGAVAVSATAALAE